ncbi:MAG: hypothetical protein H6618_02260 [Deltaproteobacteria bacterium]|nr:hypothetical protein [Deltaproteobacteria bacterium]
MKSRFILTLTACLPFIGNSCAYEDSRAAHKQKTSDIIEDKAPILYAVESDFSDSHAENLKQPFYSIVWFTEADEQGDLRLIRRPCKGLHTIDNDSYKNCQLPENHHADAVSFKKAEDILKQRAKEEGITSELTEDFTEDLKEDGFVHKLRNMNIFGQNNSLKQQYPADYPKLCRILSEVFEQLLKPDQKT